MILPAVGSDEMDLDFRVAQRDHRRLQSQGVQLGLNLRGSRLRAAVVLNGAGGNAVVVEGKESPKILGERERLYLIQQYGLPALL